jgi:hypothetical protein
MSTSNRRNDRANPESENVQSAQARASNGRDARGRFAPGNVGGPGNPFARKVATLRTALIETVTEEDMRYIAEQLVVIARLGDLAAIKLLFQYVLGKPAAAVDPDTLDLQELELYRRGPSPQALAELTSDRVPAEAVAEVLRVQMPCVGADFKNAIAREVLGIEPNDEAEDRVEGQQQEAPSPSPNREVADDRGRKMTAPTPGGGRNLRAEAAALLEELRRRVEAGRRSANGGASPLGNGPNGRRDCGETALDVPGRPGHG